MPTYISLCNWTERGIASIKESPNRIQGVREVAQRHNAQLKEWYLTMGAYDFVAIIEAPDDETVARLLLAVGAQGNARTTTLRAFSEEQFAEMAASLG
jgi:uncharacterized protein with GYD domain